MRRGAGIGLLALGIILVLAGTAVAVAMGPDDRLTTGPHDVRTDGRAVVTKPAVLARYGPQVSVLVEVPDEKPVFVGLGHTVDVEDYVSSTARVEVTRYRVPWSLERRDATGEPQLRAAPTALDWWLAQSSGIGGAQLRFTLPDDAVSLAVLAVGDFDLRGLRVTASYEVPGAFGVGVGTAATGLGVVLLALVALKWVPGVRRTAPAVDAVGFVDDEWDVPWPETDPADADTWDDFLSEDSTPPATKAGSGAAGPRAGGGRWSRWRRRKGGVTRPKAAADKQKVAR
ncbi:hypothetical protein [Mumia quercus]|uniref:hypothetical protein n=1 Tax=Mumia quercus TaxID=2976125 RepID=UPI0021D194F0|nr:hypothetical protein [Mumia quercus]